MFTASTLELLDVLLAHIDQKRQVGRVSPQADYVAAFMSAIFQEVMLCDKTYPE